VKAGFTYKYYQSLEAGRKIDFRMSTLQKLARAFALEPWELLHPAAPLAVSEGANDKPDYSAARKRRTR
jgi:hypothetical protein